MALQGFLGPVLVVCVCATKTMIVYIHTYVYVHIYIYVYRYLCRESMHVEGGLLGIWRQGWSALLADMVFLHIGVPPGFLNGSVCWGLRLLDLVSGSNSTELQQLLGLTIELCSWFE